MKSRMFGAIAIYVGTAIGAGIFAIPYAIHQVGFLIGILYLLGICLIVMLTSLVYGEVVLRTYGKHQMSEYAHRYTGRFGQIIITASILFGTYGALTAYTLEVGTFLHALFSPWFPGSVFFYRLIFFTLASIVLFIGLGLIERVEKIMMVLLLFVVVGLTVIGVPNIHAANLFTFPGANYLLPYGVIFFAFAAATSIPDMKYILNGQRKKLKHAIMLGGLIPFAVYCLFSLVVLGVSGEQVTPSAILGLSEVIGPIALTIGAIFGILTMSTSFFALGEALKEVYRDDFKVRPVLAWLFVLVIPLMIFMLNLTSFVQVISIVGAVMGGSEGIMFLWMHHAAKRLGSRKPEYTISLWPGVRVLLVILFLFGILYQGSLAIRAFL